MKILEKSDATGSLAEYTANIEKEPVIVTSDGIPIAALVPIGNVDLETMSLSTCCVHRTYPSVREFVIAQKGAYRATRCGVDWERVNARKAKR